MSGAGSVSFIRLLLLLMILERNARHLSFVRALLSTQPSRSSRKKGVHVVHILPNINPFPLPTYRRFDITEKTTSSASSELLFSPLHYNRPDTRQSCWRSKGSRRSMSATSSLLSSEQASNRPMTELKEEEVSHRKEEQNQILPSNLVIILAGPTGVGKSDVAAWLSEHLPESEQHHQLHYQQPNTRRGGTIVSADSVQAYEGVLVGANKPSPEERERHPHLLIDFVDVSDNNYNAAEWTSDALLCIDFLLGKEARISQHDNGNRSVSSSSERMSHEEQQAKQRRQDLVLQQLQGVKKQTPLTSTPIIVGGTMMYLQWLVHGRPDAAKPTESACDRAIEFVNKHRKVINDDEGAGGDEGFLDAVETVAEKFPVLKDRVAKLSNRDWYRLRRTLEIAYTVEEDTTGKLHLEDMFQGQLEGGLLSRPSSINENNSDDYDGYDVRCFFLCPHDRMKHTAVVDARCEDMLVRGLLRETADLFCSDKLPDMAARAIGYRQALDYLQSSPESGSSLDSFLDDFTTATRRYAKKQMQWFRKDRSFCFVKVDLDEKDKSKRVMSAAERILQLCSMNRKEYDELELRNECSASSMAKKENEAQGKGMKFYIPTRYILKQGSDAYEKVASEAAECQHRVRARSLQPTIGQSKRQRKI